MKKILTILICVLSIFCLNVDAAKKSTKKTTKNTTTNTMPAVVEGKEKVKVYIFTRENCGYCVAAEDYLKSIESTYGNYFDLVIYEVYNSSWVVTNKTYYELMNRVSKLFGTQVGGTPYIVVGDSYDINGWDTTSTGDEIKSVILKEYVNDKYKDVVAETLAQIESEPDPHAHDGLIISGIAIGLVAIIGAVVFFNRKNTK